MNPEDEHAIAPIESQLTRASGDDMLIAMWLDADSRPANTVDSYRRDIEEFRKFNGYLPLQSITLEDAQNYTRYLSERRIKDRPLQPATIKRKLNALKSLFTFATTLGYTRFNVGAQIRLPKSPTKLAQRILQPEDTRKLLKAAKHSRKAERNELFAKLMFATGARVSEICGLTWDCFQPQGNGNIQVSFFQTKSGKSRAVKVPVFIWNELLKLKPAHAKPGDRVFGIGRKMGHVIIKKAVELAGDVPENASCHWLRHAHAHESIKSGAPLHLVRDTLGHASIATTNFYLEVMPDESSSDFLKFD